MYTYVYIYLLIYIIYIYMYLCVCIYMCMYTMSWYRHYVAKIKVCFVFLFSHSLCLFGLLSCCLVCLQAAQKALQREDKGSGYG